MENRVALITGAGRGIGAQIARTLAAEHIDIAVVDYGEQAAAQETLDALASMGVAVRYYQCDVSDFAATKAVADAVVRDFGKIDILVNAGGVGGSGDPALMTDEQWYYVVDTDLTGLFRLCREVARLSMIPNNYGRIVNVSSMHGFVSRKHVWTAPYCAAKGGVHMMTKALANDWGKYDITVNCIAPGYFPSELTEKYIDADWFTQLHVDRCPKGRHGETGEMDGLCVYFASRCCSYTTGQTVAVDGGWTCT